MQTPTSAPSLAPDGEAVNAAAVDKKSAGAVSNSAPEQPQSGTGLSNEIANPLSLPPVPATAYLQHRAQTLACWMMLCLSLSYRLDDSVFAVKASLNPTALFLVSFLALAMNIGVFVYHFRKVIKYQRNIAVGVHSDLGEYKALVTERVQELVTVPLSQVTA